MKDMNVAKLASVDLPLFLGVISDLFPGVETPVIDYSKVRPTPFLSDLTYSSPNSLDLVVCCDSGMFAFCNCCGLLSPGFQRSRCHVLKNI